jgi:hypothetical protein
MIGCLFRTVAPAFRLGAAAGPSCSNAVQVEGTGDSTEHEHHLTCRPFRLDATHGRLCRAVRGSLPHRPKGPFRACSTPATCCVAKARWVIGAPLCARRARSDARTRQRCQGAR